MNTKSEPEKFYGKIAEGVKFRSKSNWYQYGEKYTRFFLNPEIGGSQKNY